MGETIATDEKTQSDLQKQTLPVEKTVESKAETMSAAAAAPKEETHTTKEEKQSDDADSSPCIYYVVRQTPVVKRRPRRSLFESFFDFPQHPFASYGRRRPVQHGYSLRASPFYFGNVPAVYHKAPSRRYSSFAYGSPAYYGYLQQPQLFFY